MTHIYNYIVKLDYEMSDTFQTESGVILYGHKDYSKDRLANREARIESQPLIYDGHLIDTGTKVFIDPGIFFHSRHTDSDSLQLTTNTIDRKEGIYSIEPSNIVLYQKDGEWKGYTVNFLGKRVVEYEEEKKIGSVIVETEGKKKKDVCEVVYTNEFLDESGVEKGDRLVLRHDTGVPVWIGGVEYIWLRDNDVLGVYEQV